nr:MAG TPA: hypothetical protein [Caudoviricetes sp.]
MLLAKSLLLKCFFSLAFIIASLNFSVASTFFTSLLLRFMSKLYYA